jgi:RNA polymerase sigma-70 factor (ECF subfamily)
MSAVLVANEYRSQVRALQDNEVRRYKVLEVTGYPRPAHSMAEARRQVIQQAYEDYVEQIYKFIYLKVGNREDAEDLTSQVFIKATTCLDIAQDERAKLAWLYQVARTTIADHWRQYYAKAASIVEGLQAVSLIELATGPIYLSDTQEEDTNQAIKRVESILAMLPEKHRRILELRFLQGYSLKEVAEVMGITETNARVLQHRALQRTVRVGSRLMDVG